MKTKNKGGNVKARVMWAMTDPKFRVLNDDAQKRLKMRSPHDTIPDYIRVAVIPLDDVDDIVTRAMAAFGSDGVILFRPRMYAALDAIGIPCKLRGKGAK